MGQSIVEQRARLLDKQSLFEEQLSLVSASGEYVLVPAGADYMVEMYPPFQLSYVISPCKFINPYCMMASPLNESYDSYEDLVGGNICFLSRKERDFSNYIDELSNNYQIEADTVHLAGSEHFCLVGLE